MEIGLKSLIGFSAFNLTILILQATFIILYLRSEINHSNLEIHCNDGWEPYKQEKCLKLFDTVGLWSYANAENFCKEQNDSFLISIDGAEKQEFVETLIKSNSVVGNIWIGLKHESNILQWADGTQLHYYSNWAYGSPKNDISNCFQMETEAANFGLWSDEWCGKKNLVICERFQYWSLAQLQTNMIDLMRNSVQQRFISNAQYSSSTNSIHYLNSTLTQVQTSLKSSVSNLTNTDQNMNSTLTQLKTNLANSISSSTNSIERLNFTLTQSQTSGMHTISNPLLPVGFIYVQLPKEKRPAEMWPWMVWIDISSEYAGLFSRTVGGNVAPLGEIQNVDSPRLISLIEDEADDQEFNEINVLANNEYSFDIDGSDDEPLGIDDSDDGPLAIDGSDLETQWGIPVMVSNGEVRPVNMAIRIWKRIG